MTKLSIPVPLILATTSESFSWERRSLADRKSLDLRDFDNVSVITIDRIPREDLEELLTVAVDQGAKKFEKTLAAILAPGGEQGWKVPSIEAFQKLVADYIRETCVNGWLWKKAPDGRYLPYAVTRIDYIQSDRTKYETRPHVNLHVSWWGMERREDGQLKLRHEVWTFMPGDVSNRRIPSILEARDIRAAEEDMLRDWDKAMVAFDEVLSDGFAKQFRITGPVSWTANQSSRDLVADGFIGNRAICDTDPSMMKDCPAMIASSVMGTAQDPRDIPLPRHPLVLAFDLSTHDTHALNTASLSWYEYDKGLRDKLVLPDTHVDMLDVLTTDIDALTEDVIEGKSAGNIILAKGPAGTGKTLMAEVYTELMERPLYRMHAGTLGTSDSVISKSLQEVFRRAARWGCVLLIDEADVFVMTRGDDIERNAVTAEFLRALEYFPGMIFMTTNRPHDIDEAVLSRCAAVLQFDAPSPKAAARIWKTQAENFGYEMEDELIGSLVAAYPGATGRDIKQLMRQSLRYAGKRTEDGRVTGEIVRKVAMFRGVEMTGAPRKEHQDA